MVKINQFVVASSFLWFANSTSASPFPSIVTIDDNGGLQSISTPQGGSSFQLDSNGNPVICAFTTNPAFDLEVIHCYDPGCVNSGTISIVTVDSADAVGSGCSIALTSNGLPVVAHWDQTNGDLKFAFCNDADCSSSISRTVDGDGIQVGQHVTMTLDALDRPVAAYLDQTSGSLNKLRVLHCGTRDCSSGNSIEIIPDEDTSPVNNVGYASSITIGSDGNPVLTYGKSGDTISAVMLARCLDSNCASRTIRLLATDSKPSSSSLTLDSNDFPVVAYSGLGDKLTILHCADLTCETGSSVVTPDTGSTIGNFATSIQLTQNGVPIVAYADSSTNKDLKILQCGDPNCANTGTNEIITIDDTGGLLVSLLLDQDEHPVVVYRNPDVYGVKVLRYSCPASSHLTAVDGDYKCYCQKGYRSSANRVGEEVQVASDETCSFFCNWKGASCTVDGDCCKAGKKFVCRSTVCVVCRKPGSICTRNEHCCSGRCYRKKYQCM